MKKNFISLGKSSRKLKWGVAGCGRFLEETFLPTLQTIKKSKLISVYSSDIERANYISTKFGLSFVPVNIAPYLDCLVSRKFSKFI